MMNTDFSQFDPAAYRRFRVQGAAPEYSWRDANAQAMATSERADWQREFRDRFGSLLGGLEKWEKPDLAPEVLDSQQLDGYRRETIAFTTRPQLRAVGHLLIPDGLQAPQPTIICLPGHGRGARSTLGLRADSSQRGLNDWKNPEEYDADFALQCVARGYVVFVLELFSFGDRRDADMRERGAGESSCGRDAMAALMIGETLPGWRVWDVMRVLDLLQTRSEVDSNKLATMGISGGGLVSLFSAALDERISACVVSCYFNTFADSILSIDHCSDNYAPGLLQLCEMPDLAALVVPRKLFCEAGKDDAIFPLAGFEKAEAEAREIYQTYGCAENFGSEVFEGDHKFHGAGAFEFLQHWKTHENR